MTQLTMVANSITIQAKAPGWLRGLTFDSIYIWGTLTLALVSGLFVVANPHYFVFVFILNAWLLGYHHVIATFTRLTFDSDSFREHRFLILWLPMIVLAGVCVLSLIFGVWILVSVYLYWQWWHYTRQSYGVSRIYERKALGATQDSLTKWMIYAVPVWGILYRSYQAPSEYLFAEVKVFPVPFWVVAAAGSVSIVVVAYWLARQLRAWFEGTLATAHTAYLTTHIVGFTTAYVLIPDINHGWLILNVWHNSQYILTVWLFNNNRFKNEPHEKHRFLSQLSHEKNIFSYMLVCLAISMVVYLSLSYAVSWATPAVALVTSVPLVAIVYQTINFHHYVVDAVIWKVRKKKVRENLGIAG